MKTRFKAAIAAITLSVAALGATMASAADPIIGVWKTEPDRKDLISHIQISDCSGKYCGLILSAFDKSGKEVTTKNVGKKLFWDVASEGGGKYGGGTFWVPLMDVDTTPTMTLDGDSLKVQGCDHLICGHQVWTKLSGN